MNAQLTALMQAGWSESQTRVRSGLGLLTIFLIAEPAGRALLWWWRPHSSLPAILHSSSNFVAIGLLACIGLSLSSDVRQLILRYKWLPALGIVWALGVLGSATLAPNLAPAISLRWFLYLLFALHLLAALRHQPDRAATILIGLVMGFVGFAAVLFAFILLLMHPANFDWVTGVPGAFNIRNLGFEAMAAALVGSLFRPEGRPGVVGGMRLCAIIGWAFVFWSGGRGSFLAALVALIAVHALSEVPNRWQRVLESAALMAAGAGIALLHLPPSESFGFWRTIGFSSPSVAGADAGGGDIRSDRLAIWKESLEAIVASPLYGIGEAQMKHHLVSAARTYPQPHNLILQAPLAWGIPAGLAFLTAVALPLVRAVRRLRGQATLQAPATAGLAVALAMTANAFVDGTLFHPRPVTLFLVGISVALSAPLRNAVR